jgi:hypothetical protein
MNYKVLVRCGVAVCGLFSAVNPVSAQRMASTFQDNLNTRGVPANGSNDFACILYGADNGRSIAGPFTDSAAPLSIGQFTVSLEFCVAPLFPRAVPLARRVSVTSGVYLPRLMDL